MADLVSHPPGRASVEFVLLSKPHEYWRWVDHTTTYSEFKKEMWAEIDAFVEAAYEISKRTWQFDRGWGLPIRSIPTEARPAQCKKQQPRLLRRERRNIRTS